MKISTVAGAILAWMTFVSNASAQGLTVSPNPAPFGATLTVTFLNSSSLPVRVPATAGMPRLAVFSAAGELEYMEPPSTTTFLVPPNGTMQWSLTPAMLPFGPLPPGRHFAEVNFATAQLVTMRSAAAIDIGGGSTGPTFFARFNDGLDAHADASQPNVLRITNGASITQTFPMSTWILVGYGPGAAAPLTGFFGAQTLAPGASVEIPWPTAVPGLGTTQQMTLTWNDPTAGLVTDTLDATGVLPAQITGISGVAFLQRPLGSVVPLGGTLPLYVLSPGTQPCLGFCPPQFGFPAEPIGAVAFALAPGAIPLPGGAVLPLAMDPLFAATVSGALTLGGFVTGSPGPTVPVSGLAHTGRMTPVLLAHPGPSVSGATILCAGIGASPTPGYPWQTTALHPLTLQ